MGRGPYKARESIVDSAAGGDMDTLLILLKLRRIAAGLTQGQVAKVVGVDAGTVSMWETGRRVPTGTSLVAWARSVGCMLALVEVLPDGEYAVVVEDT